MLPQRAWAWTGTCGWPSWWSWGSLRLRRRWHIPSALPYWETSPCTPRRQCSPRYCSWGVQNQGWKVANSLFTKITTLPYKHLLSRASCMTQGSILLPHPGARCTVFFDLQPHLLPQDVLVPVIVDLDPFWHQNGRYPYVGKGGGRGGDTHRLTFPLVSPPPKGHFQTTQ